MFVPPSGEHQYIVVGVKKLAQIGEGLPDRHRCLKTDSDDADVTLCWRLKLERRVCRPQK